MATVRAPRYARPTRARMGTGRAGRPMDKLAAVFNDGIEVFELRHGLRRERVAPARRVKLVPEPRQHVGMAEELIERPRELARRRRHRSVSRVPRTGRGQPRRGSASTGSSAPPSRSPSFTSEPVGSQNNAGSMSRCFFGSPRSRDQCHGAVVARAEAAREHVLVREVVDKERCRVALRRVVLGLPGVGGDIGILVGEARV
jgi:hypothetical protein